MSLHIESHGSGAPLVLLHGWGMHGGVWDSVVPLLAQQFRVHCVDLPGHGYSSRIKGQEFTLDAIVAELSAQFHEPLNICGWSLGGMAALRWAQLGSQQVRRLVLVASTPCFIERDDWLFGMAEETLRQFSAELERDHAATLRRFWLCKYAAAQTSASCWPACARACSAAKNRTLVLCAAGWKYCAIWICATNWKK